MIEKALTQLDARRDEISDQRAAIEADIHNTITRLHETLDIRKTELISQLHQLTQAKLKSLAAQRDQIETIQAQLSSCLLFMRENLKTGNQGEVLMMKSTTVRQVKELTTDIPTRHVGAKHRSRHHLFSISRSHCRVSETMGKCVQHVQQVHQIPPNAVPQAREWIQQQ